MTKRGKMYQIKPKDAERILNFNGFFVSRYRGDHAIFKNERGKHISIKVTEINSCLWRRLVRENNLIEDIRGRKK